MQPQKNVKNYGGRCVEDSDLSCEEKKFLTVFRELSESDRAYLLQAASAMAMAGEDPRKCRTKV